MKMLRHAECLSYLEFGKVAGSFVLHKDDIKRVPCTVSEVLTSNLLGMFEKNRMRHLMQDISNYFSEKKTPMKLDPKEATVDDFFKKYNLEDNTRNFIVHAMALDCNDDCLTKPAYETFAKVYLYAFSMSIYGESPFIYPMYGLGDVPQAFSRLSAVWGGTYMLDKQIEEILYDEDGHVKGIKSGG